MKELAERAQQACKTARFAPPHCGVLDFLKKSVAQDQTRVPLGYVRPDHNCLYRVQAQVVEPCNLSVPEAMYREFGLQPRSVETRV